MRQSSSLDIGRPQAPITYHSSEAALLVFEVSESKVKIEPMGVGMVVWDKDCVCIEVNDIRRTPKIQGSDLVS